MPDGGLNYRIGFLAVSDQQLDALDPFLSRESFAAYYALYEAVQDQCALSAVGHPRIVARTG